MNASFTLRLRGGDRLLATFIKTPGAHAVEIAALAGLDAVVLDAEHAPFSASALDTTLLVCRAAGIAGIVRVPDARPATIGAVLDMGATGVLVPHVSSADDARAAVAAAHYRGGCRGYSNSPRAGNYGAADMADHVAAQDAGVLVMCQIEDVAGVDAVQDIALVPGVDCLFVGRADLAMSYGVYDVFHERVAHAQRVTFGAARRAGVPAGIFVGEAGAVAALAEEGCQFFVVGSDQSVLRAGLRAMRHGLETVLQ